MTTKPAEPRCSTRASCGSRPPASYPTTTPCRALDPSRPFSLFTSSAPPPPLNSVRVRGVPSALGAKRFYPHTSARSAFASLVRRRPPYSCRRPLCSVCEYSLSFPLTFSLEKIAFVLLNIEFINPHLAFRPVSRGNGAAGANAVKGLEPRAPSPVLADGLAGSRLWRLPAARARAGRP